MNFTFTADHEEPCCNWCDNHMCDGKKVKCGPTYGWALYARTVEDKDMTSFEKMLVEMIKENTK